MVRPNTRYDRNTTRGYRRIRTFPNAIEKHIVI